MNAYSDFDAPVWPNLRKIINGRHLVVLYSKRKTVFFFFLLRLGFFSRIFHRDVSSCSEFIVRVPYPGMRVST